MSFAAKYEVKPQHVAILRQEYYALKQLSLVLHAVSGLKDFDGPVVRNLHFITHCLEHSPCHPFFLQRFVPRNQHYKLGLNKLVYSWRPVRFIFVDFAVRRVKCSDQTYFQLLKEENGHLVAHDYIANVRTLHLSFCSGFDCSVLFEQVKTDVWDGCVMECFWDPNAQTAVPKSDGSEEVIVRGNVERHLMIFVFVPCRSGLVDGSCKELERIGWSPIRRGW